jgi:hypothetical protein
VTEGLGADEALALADAFDASWRTSIISFWYPRAIDPAGGYRVGWDARGRPAQDERGTVSQARLVYVFARAVRAGHRPDAMLAAAHHGLAYLRDVLWDAEHGGFVWSLDRPQKTTYAQAFALFALAYAGWAFLRGVPMLLNGDDRIAEYSYSSPFGIRSNPYAGYSRTYANVTGSEVHYDGEVFAAIIWRLIELFDEASIPRDVLMDYFVDGMNYTPSTPAFEDMREGMLASVASGPSPGHCSLIWQAFAQFGVGVGASATVSGSTVTVIESFAMPVSCP